jgi:predicted ArsR family transcriptional regulator
MGTHKERILKLLKKSKPLTDEEIAIKLDISPNTERPRRLELEAAGLVVACGYALTKAGKRALLWTAAERVL